MSGPLTNHTLGNMQHAEYEAKARKHQAPKRERTLGLKLNIASTFSALSQKFNKPMANASTPKFETQNI